LGWPLSGFADCVQVAPDQVAFGEQREQAQANLAECAVQYVEVECPF
jgi:hypothetical protein